MLARTGLLPLLFPLFPASDSEEDDDDDNGEIASTLFSSSALGVVVVIAVVVAVVIEFGVVGINDGGVVVVVIAVVAVIELAASPPPPTLLLRPAKLLRNESIILTDTKVNYLDLTNYSDSSLFGWKACIILISIGPPDNIIFRTDCRNDEPQQIGGNGVGPSSFFLVRFVRRAIRIPREEKPSSKLPTTTLQFGHDAWKYRRRRPSIMGSIEQYAKQYAKQY